ncbi:MAG TPA: methyltransferase domain-containing protein [Candidatus Methylomirabilis sp.]|nr:methyltransferase domain-containing protein [Candidatus Methylomirabilis sp.]
MERSERIKDFYCGHSDEIIRKRFDSPEPLRRYAHRTQYDALIANIPTGSTVLDAGCGEGVISLLLAERGNASTGVDLSSPNVEAARREALRRGVGSLATFVQGDAEALPFPDKSFDIVVSSHVLEHLPDFDQGARELVRVAKRRVVVALPTCLNLAAAAVLGNDNGFWRFGKKSVVAFPWGILRIVGHLFGEGVQEGYAGSKELPHIWRYPWVMRRRLERATGWKIVRFEASTLVLPYFPRLLGLIRRFDRYRAAPLLRNLGYGSIAVLEPSKS